MSHLTDQLNLRLTQKITDLYDIGDVTHTADGPVIHRDNGSNVLAVAHLDTVMTNYQYRMGTTGVFECPQLDDRLGLWYILDLLPDQGLNVDVLLTDSEECGRSTAQYFETEKRYNWMCEFDRRGTAAVCYQYHDDDMEFRLDAHGFEVDHGSFSDISYLDHLGCKGINFGCGYYHEHSMKCYALFSDIKSTIIKFKSFFHAYHNLHMPHVPQPYTDRWADYDYYENKWSRVFKNLTDNPGDDEDDCDHMEELICVCGSVIDEYAFDCPDCGMDVEVLIDQYYNGGEA